LEFVLVSSVRLLVREAEKPELMQRRDLLHLVVHESVQVDLHPSALHLLQVPVVLKLTLPMEVLERGSPEVLKKFRVEVGILHIQMYLLREFLILG
jgi:hypothetical protein